MIERFLSRLVDPADKRGNKALKNIAFSAGLKAINAAISFIIIPLYLSYLTEISFGIWLTVSAVINWFNFFDLGLGNGLRNRFAEARAAEDHRLARQYVSTTYAILAIISGALLLVFLMAHQFIDWSVIFATPDYLKQDVNHMVLILAVLFCPQFVLQLIKMILTADQRPAAASVMNTSVNVLQLAALYLLTFAGEGSLSKLALAMALINLSIPILATIYFFQKEYAEYSPQYSHIEFSFSKDLMGLGFTFFILQGAALVVFMTDNLIITQVLGPEEVPAYNISYRYFNLLVVFFGLVTTPFWSAFTEAFAKKDMGWIKRVMQRLLKVWFAVALLGFGAYFLSPWVYEFWIGSEVIIPNVLNISMLFWVLASTGLSIYGTFLSGVGKLRLSVIHALTVMVINIPLSIWLAGFPKLGSAGVILASLICVLLRLFYQPAQAFKIMNGTAKGVWDK